MGKRKLNTIIRAAIDRERIKLVARVQKNGIYEDFGDFEFTKIRDKFNYSKLIYGTNEEREAAKLIDEFFNWCINFEI